MSLEHVSTIKGPSSRSTIDIFQQQGAIDTFQQHTFQQQGATGMYQLYSEDGPLRGETCWNEI
jgi:hypothetical protein